VECLVGETSVLAYLPVASFAIALGGLLVRFFVPAGPARQTAVAAVLIFLLLASALVWRQNQDCKRQIEQAADDIVRILGNQKLTYEEIVVNTRNPTYFKLNAGIDLLIQQRRVGTELVAVTERGTGRTYQITLFFVRTPL
jgi:hypothetical protein